MIGSKHTLLSMATIVHMSERESTPKNAKEFCCTHLGRVIRQFHLAHRKILLYLAIHDLNKLIKEPTKQLLALSRMCFSVHYVSFACLYIPSMTERYIN